MTGDEAQGFAAPPPRIGRALAGGVALVTGGTRGIGAAVVRALTGRGMVVATLARTTAGAGDDGRTYRCDVGDADQVRDAVAHVMADHDRLDVLVTNAGVAMGADADVADTLPRDWDRMLRTNLAGTYLVARAALPHLRRSHGQIVTVLSLGAHRVRAGSVAYAATKHAARALTEGLALEESGVRVSSVSPGPVDTSVWDAKDTPPDAATRARMLTADDVAEAVIWLLERPDHVYIPDIRIAPRNDPFTDRAHPEET